ncbi:hypothetical protein P152DRAFT_460422 [Eremomyces bilateralis CBS 781.70]|uniref:Uncharacterized protein n=1 Tax=Eremomyces bilateralis CBS 781.70 TaxID=1392243 RepID=A0A6G1FWU8_9PEZI|nr:uncharacterized protein P152DRAFT_460422 [Eremomyces bilateralis CBS 781.70]KAF1810317.1 hypothetical protein P152DRAFT_460422 [Eremomyces bilateralis CBS 781.70]
MQGRRRFLGEGFVGCVAPLYRASNKCTQICVCRMRFTLRRDAPGDVSAGSILRCDSNQRSYQLPRCFFPFRLLGLWGWTWSSEVEIGPAQWRSYKSRCPPGTMQKQDIPLKLAFTSLAILERESGSIFQCKRRLVLKHHRWSLGLSTDGSVPEPNGALETEARAISSTMIP